MKKIKLCLVLLAMLASISGCKKSKGGITVNITKYTNCQTSNGPIIPASGANVTLETTTGAAVATATASSSGQVVFDDLEAGDYNIFAYVEINFCTQEGEAIVHIADNESKTINIQLQ